MSDYDFNSILEDQTDEVEETEEHVDGFCPVEFLNRYEATFTGMVVVPNDPDQNQELIVNLTAEIDWEVDEYLDWADDEDDPDITYLVNGIPISEELARSIDPSNDTISSAEKGRTKMIEEISKLKSELMALGDCTDLLARMIDLYNKRNGFNEAA